MVAFVNNATVKLPIAFEYATFIQGWALSADITSGDLSTNLESVTYFGRSQTTRFFSVFINILMWLLSIFLMIMTVGIWLRGGKVEPPALTFNAALLFAMPAIRQVQPSIPPIGCIADAVGFFWCMAIISVCMLAMMLNYIIKYEDQPVGSLSKTKDWTEDAAPKLANAPTSVVVEYSVK